LVKPPHMCGNAGRAPTFELYPRIWLTAEEKSRKNLSQGREKVPSGHDSYRRFGRPWLSRETNFIKHPRLALQVGQVTLGQRKYLPSCRKKGFLASANFLSRNSQSWLCCGRQKIKLPNPYEFACY
jgi:hypothetical protein